MISSEVRLVLKCRVVSSLSFFRIYSQAFSTGIAVKSETTSNDTMASSSEISRLATWTANSTELETE